MLFHAMVRFGPKLERRQMVLFRGVDIGADLFAMTASCVRAQMLAEQGNHEATELADLFCRDSRRRVKRLFSDMWWNDDVRKYRVAQQVMRGEHAWLETGIISPLEERGDGASLAQTRAHQRTPQATNAV